MKAATKKKHKIIPFGGYQHRIPRIKPKLFANENEKRSGGIVLKDDHPAIREKRTLFPSMVIDADESPRILISGHNSRKIGKVVTHTAWKNMPIYTMTLEERATCPSSCKNWNFCYGNGTPFARRHRLDEDFIVCLSTELAQKQNEHPEGYVVRAHVLGDFGSPDNPELALLYVRMWDLALKENPALRMFSYTAHDPNTRIGRAIAELNRDYPERCRIRFSGHERAGEGAIVIESITEAWRNNTIFVCPAQTGESDCCATCGLCWTMDKTVAFLRH